MDEYISILSPLLDEGSLEVNTEICRDDGMHAYAPQIYFEAGRDALRISRLAMLAARLEKVESVLDFACGGGRALRYFKAAFPDAELTAVDILPHQVEFCSRVFGANGIVSKGDPDELGLEGPFDLIWCGSLLTHQDREMWAKSLGLFERVVSPGGVVLFTAYGRYVAELLRSGDNKLNLTDEGVEDILREYGETGFGYQKTRWDGDALATRPWVCAQLNKVPALDLLLYFEHAWLGQDVIACTKARP
jgi:SAM-dependent methyltransferase